MDWLIDWLLGSWLIVRQDSLSWYIHSQLKMDVSMRKEQSGFDAPVTVSVFLTAVTCLREGMSGWRLRPEEIERPRVVRRSSQWRPWGNSSRKSKHPQKQNMHVTHSYFRRNVKTERHPEKVSAFSFSALSLAGRQRKLRIWEMQENSRCSTW